MLEKHIVEEDFQKPTEGSKEPKPTLEQMVDKLIIDNFKMA